MRARCPECQYLRTVPVNPEEGYWQHLTCEWCEESFWFQITRRGSRTWSNGDFEAHYIYDPESDAIWPKPPSSTVKIIIPIMPAWASDENAMWKIHQNAERMAREQYFEETNQTADKALLLNRFFSNGAAQFREETPADQAAGVVYFFEMENDS